MKVTRQRFATALAMFLTLVVLVSLIILYRPMYPISMGTSDEFWWLATGVDLGGRRAGMGGVVMIEGDYAYYTPASLDSTWTYRLTVNRVMKDYPRVMAELEKRAADPTNHDDATVAYRRWKSLPSDMQGGPAGIEKFIKEAISIRLATEQNPPIDFLKWSYDMRAEMRKQVATSHYYWANFTMELLFLSGLAWFALWPAIRNLSLVRWLLHAALAPFLFLLPSWLGYCAVCAGGVGPAGGILYPYLIWFIHVFDNGSNAAWELDFFRNLPKLFEPINQTAWQLNGVIDPKFSLSIHITGPIDAAIAGGILCSGILLCRLAAGRIRFARARRPGFEIIPNSKAANHTSALSSDIPTGTVTPPPIL